MRMRFMGVTPPPKTIPCRACGSRSCCALAAKSGRKLDWVNCGLCVDERGVGEAIEGVRRGSPADFWKMSVESANTLADRHALGRRTS